MRWLSAVLGALFLLPVSATAVTYRVAPDGGGDFPTIQGAIDASLDGDIIELASGTFTGDGNRDLDFLGKAVVVQSEIGDPVTCFLDCGGSESEPHRGVRFVSGEGPTSVLEGVTIKNGWVSGNPSGSAVLCQGGGSPAIRNCIFVNNTGSAMAIEDGSNPTIADCNFRWNHAEQGAGAWIGSSHPAFARCYFEENVADWSGGAVQAQGSSADFDRCTFRRNSAGVSGAAHLIFSSVCTFTDCYFTGNSAEEHGAVLVFFTTARMTRCTFVWNEALHGGSTVGSGKMAYTYLTSCTFYGNVGGEGTLFLGERESRLDRCLVAFNWGAPACGSEGPVSLTCCDIFGNEGGDWVGNIAEQYGQAGNISLDPLFCDPGEADFRIAAESPCAPFSPPNPECDLIGAWPVGCGGTPVKATTWGDVKASYR